MSSRGRAGHDCGIMPLAVHCGYMDMYPSFATHNYDDLRHRIKSGDILLCSGTSIFSNMIKQATNSIWSHVAFILRLDVIDRILVLESIESIGVRAVPLSSYARDYNGSGKGYPGRVLIARHQELKQENIANLSKIAVDLLGYPYAKDQILRIAARIGAGTLGANHFTPVAPHREFICSEYAYVCFKSVGITIEYNPLGFIAPADFARCEHVVPVSYIETQEMIAGIIS